MLLYFVLGYAQGGFLMERRKKRIASVLSCTLVLSTLLFHLTFQANAKVTPRIRDWAAEYKATINGLTPLQYKYLDSLGVDLTDPKALQRALGVIDDGMFGPKSRAALDAKLANMPREFATNSLNPESELPPIYQPTQQQVVTPNYGYRTNNTYEGDNFRNYLTGLGINSNKSLIDWLTTPSKYNQPNEPTWLQQFRTDVNKALESE